MPDKSLIIIGAGIAGLAAGCYGQMNGYQTQIFEMHTEPGGLCTAWHRKGYTFDGCIHWLMGTAPESPFYQVWNELGGLAGRRMITHDEFVRIVAPDGKALIMYAKIDRLEQHLKELSPVDTPVIDEFIAAMREFSHFNMMPSKPRELMTPEDGMQMMAQIAPYMPGIQKWSSISAGQFAERFQDPFLRQAFPMVFGAQMPMSVYLMFLPPMDHGDCGVPEGGSLEFSRAIARRYQELGGQIHYGCRVAKILVAEEPQPAGAPPCARATGVGLEDGREFYAGTVISAADGHTTLFSMLGDEYVSDEFRGDYCDLQIFSPVIQVSLGIKRDLSAEPHAVTFVLDRPVTIAGEPRDTLPIRHYCFDPSMAPAGKSAVVAFLGTNYAYWKQAAQEPERYESEKQQAATAIIDQLESRYPGITADIEVIDVATPLTTERYTGNWQGSIEGWLPFDAQGSNLMELDMSKTLPGLEDFYMAGQWVQPGGGLPGVAPSGRNVVQLLCHRDDKPFVTTVPA